MNRLLAALLGAAALAAPAVARAADATLVWHGQSCFLLTSSKGTRVLIDPIPGTIGYPLPVPMSVDAVTISHEHPDHNNVGLAKDAPRVLRGLQDPKTWAKIDEKIRDVHIRNVGVWHDQKHGAERGLNSAFVFELDGLTVAHLGDLGHLLTPEQLAAIGKVDVLLIPVGGTYTIDGPTAWKVVEQVKPKWVVVPMHYKTEPLKIPLADENGFVASMHSRWTFVRRLGSNQLVLTQPAKTPEVVVLSWK
jgi:L-ascorbate metabolism protein UlaG (beta-lactamase superfamily)